MDTFLPPQENSITPSPTHWREDFLQRILITTAIIGFFALIPAVSSADSLTLQGVYIGVFAILVGAIVIKLPYIVKASIYIILPYLLGVGDLSGTGILGDSLFFFLAFVIFTSLLINARGGAIAILVSEITIIIMGFLVITGHITLSDPNAISGELGDWISGSVSQLMFSLVILIGLRMLQEGYEQARTKTEETMEILHKTQSELEKSVEKRTEQLANKTSQMNASTIVAHQAASIQDLNILLTSTVDLISKHFGYYHVAIFLINPRGDYATLQAASSSGGKILIEKGYRLRVGVEGIVGFVASERLPRIALDVGEDAFYFDTPDLPDTRSELALPLIVREKTIGVLDMQSKKVSDFHHDEIEIFQTLADQIAIAIENSRLLTDSQLTISQLEIISSENSRRNWQVETATKTPAFHYSPTGLKPIKEPLNFQGKNVLTVPLILRGQKIGQISLHRKDEFQNWTPQEETVATEVANQTTLALENVRLVERSRQRAIREQEISKMTSRIRETLDLETVLRTSARELQSTLELEEAEIRLIAQENSGHKEENN